MLASKRNGTLYVGVTSNIIERMGQHREGEAGGFTSRYGVHMLVWFECHDSMHEAIAREKALKEWKRAWKLRLIEERNPQWRDLSEDLY
ncbi:MAG: GIY-YIG nuclease family protein [Chloroflexi bacterium]|nr:GIY-YIG nuclease family protein [Chloroflexota bacterium]MCY3936832.1 GIY-YIG nuclease family protein [Chloroflexota bacterium]